MTPSGTSPLATITAVDTSTGLYDVIVQLKVDDLDKPRNSITQDLQFFDEVQSTTTCLFVDL